MDSIQTFAVLLGNRTSVEAALVSLAKRAERKGLPVLSWTVARRLRGWTHEGLGGLGMAGDFASGR